MLDLNGSLQGIGLPALVQLVGQQRATGRLELTSDGWMAELGFVDGRLVSARCGDQQGLGALATCLAAPPDGHFVFVQGPVSVNGAGQPAPDLARPCPSLGFADDQARHYSRPTALHRCYATQAPTAIGLSDQRDLCLGGGFSTCARFLRLGLGQTTAPAAQARATPTNHTAAVPYGPERRWPVLLAICCLVLAVAAIVGVLARLRLPDTAAEPDLAAATDSVETPLDFGSARATAPDTAVATVAPFDTPVPATRAPAVLPRRSPTSTPTADVVLDDRFGADSQSGWLEDPPFAAWSDGAYRLFAREPTRFVAVDAPAPDSLADVRVGATMRKTGGPPGGGYGLVVRARGAPRDGENQDFEAYVFECGDVGEFGIWRRDGDHWVDLVPWTRSPEVRIGGSPNDLTVRAVGAHLSFSINGKLVGQVDDETLDAGAVGLFVGGDLNQAAVDRFSAERAD